MTEGRITCIKKTAALFTYANDKITAEKTEHEGIFCGSFNDAVNISNYKALVDNE
jgi:hypothetical protein